MQNLSKAELVRVGKKIKQARKRLGKTQEEASAIADISAQYWSAVETGRDRGSVATYLKVAGALGLTLNDLFYEQADLIRHAPSQMWADLLDGLNEYEQTLLTSATLSLKAAMMRSRKLL